MWKIAGLQKAEKNGLSRIRGISSLTRCGPADLPWPFGGGPQQKSKNLISI